LAPAATAPADPNTPQGTLVLLSRARASGDADAARALMHATTAQQKKFVDVLLERSRTYLRFRQAAIAALGEEAANQFTDEGASDPAADEDLVRRANVKFQDNSATVEMANATAHLVRVDGKWKVDMAASLEGMKPEEIDRVIREFELRLGIVKQTTEELAQGEYKTAAEVSDAIKSKLASEWLKMSTTAPADASATAPAATERK
jgi:hypothetical protein